MIEMELVNISAFGERGCLQDLNLNTMVGFRSGWANMNQERKGS